VADLWKGLNVTWSKLKRSSGVRITLTIEGGETATFLTEGVKTIMSAISDFAKKVNANFASIQSGIKALDDKITAFQNSPGTLSPEDQAALDDIVKTSGDLATAAQAAVPVVPPTAA
jgi:hypothetical protein